MVECNNFPLSEEDCKKCKEYPCHIIRSKEKVDNELWELIKRFG